MKAQDFINIIGADFYTGVPDSLLRSLCDFLTETYGDDPKRHIIAANEGNAAAIAAGYHLSTGKIPAVYMQNSGEGNIINPLASLLNDKVYQIPAIFIIGWRGEPEVHDEPQHIFQGEVTLKLLEDMNVKYFVIEKETKTEKIAAVTKDFQTLLGEGKQVAFVIKKGALTYAPKIEYKNNNKMRREEIIERIVKISGNAPIISTTGKTSRELFEIREKNSESHERDFLTVGSMGHASSIALGVALNKPNQKIWCVDGDGAFLMHMGAAAVIGKIKPKNLIHIAINNGAHESVGGMPTAAKNINLSEVAKSCGYVNSACVDNFEDLEKELKKAKTSDELYFIEAKCAIGSREDLGRPTLTAVENKANFMRYLENPTQEEF